VFPYPSIFTLHYRHQHHLTLKPESQLPSGHPRRSLDTDVAPAKLFFTQEHQQRPKKAFEHNHLPQHINVHPTIKPFRVTSHLFRRKSSGIVRIIDSHDSLPQVHQEQSIQPTQASHQQRPNKSQQTNTQGISTGVSAPPYTTSVYYHCGSVENWVYGSTFKAGILPHGHSFRT
jgi:hypothetical protein